MAGSRATKSRKLTPKGPLVVSRMAPMSFAICSAGVRAMPSVPRPPALLTAATRGTEVAPAIPPSTIGCRIRSRSQTGVWIKSTLRELSCPVQFNAIAVTATPAWMAGWYQALVLEAKDMHHAIELMSKQPGVRHHLDGVVHDLGLEHQ